MAELKEEMRAEVSNSTTPEDTKETAPGVEHETVPNDETGDQEAGEQRQQREVDDNFGMLILAGENEEHGPGGYGSLSFE